MNISSVLIQTLPRNIDEVIKIIKLNPEVCEYHLHDQKGRIIVTIEGEDVEAEVKKLVKIQSFNHVISADMMMTYQEDQLDEEVKRLEMENPVPEILTKKDIDPRKVVYNGDLKGRF